MTGVQTCALPIFLFIEKRLERIKKDLRSKNEKRLQEEEALLTRFREHLEADLPLRTLETSEQEEALISGYPFLTRKRLLTVINVDDDKVTDTSLGSEAASRFEAQAINIMQVPVSLEHEIALLDSEEEKAEFMADAGIKVSALMQLSTLAMESLNLISYFTVGSDEVKQWLVRNGAFAPEAAGVIHSDIERGFIRAEMFKCDELFELGSEDALKKAGKFHLMGKDYPVCDGDIMNFRFNV